MEEQQEVLEIKINTQGTLNLSLEELVDIQGEVKSLFPEELEKMIESFKTHGFCEPFVVFKENPKESWKIISGNQRRKAIFKCKELGLKVPDKFPCVELKAKSLKDAKKVLLSLGSTFGRVNKRRLEIFSEEINLPLEEVNLFSSFPTLTLEDSFDGINDELQKTDVEDTSIDFIKIPFLSEDINRIKDMFEAVFYKMQEKYPKKVSTPSDAFLKILKDALK